jgi:hypothetical protein
MAGDVLLPPNYRDVDGSLIFLAGPIQGAPEWHNIAIPRLQELCRCINVASPSKHVDEGYRAMNPTKFDKTSDQEGWEQVDWETFYLERAAKEGTILFWLPREHTHICKRAYAQTSREELGKWFARKETRDVNIAIAIQEGFSGEQYLRYVLPKEHPGLVIGHSLEDVCHEALRLACS